MRIGVPKEIKTQEYRVGMTPAGVAILTHRGHTVLVEQGAGTGSGLPDAAYVKAGATMVATKDEVWGQADMVVKVKEPIAPEFPLMRKDQEDKQHFQLQCRHSEEVDEDQLADVVRQKGLPCLGWRFALLRH